MANKGPQELDDRSIVNRLNHLEADVEKLAQIASHNAIGLDKLSKAIEIQTGTLECLIDTTKDQNELVEGIAHAIEQLSIANQENQPLLGSSQLLTDDPYDSSEDLT